jgi:sialidase-1
MKLSLTNKIIKSTAVIALSLLLTPWTGIVNSSAHTTDESIYLGGSWVRDEAGWRFYSEWNGVYPAGQWGEYEDHSYYFMDNSYLATGWTFVNDRWYYFNPHEGKYQGSMMTGWIFDADYDGWFYTNELGIMVTGWHKIGGYWYYFQTESDGKQGLMAANQFIEGFYVNSDGQMNE